MHDVRMLKRARLYVDAMSQGINPLTGEYASKDDVISQERVQRCMGYILTVLDDVLKTGIGSEKQEFHMTPAQKSQVLLSDNEIGVNDLAKRINSAIDTGFVKGVTGTKIATWLVRNGYLSEQTHESTTKRSVKVLNEKSMLLGIHERKKTKSSGESYMQLVYTKSAQQFILEHIDEIAKE